MWQNKHHPAICNQYLFHAPLFSMSTHLPFQFISSIPCLFPHHSSRSITSLTLLTSPHLTPPHPTSPHLTPPHLTSSHLTPLHPTSPHLTPPHPTSPHLTPPHPTSPHPTSPHSTFSNLFSLWILGWCGLFSKSN